MSSRQRTPLGRKRMLRGISLAVVMLVALLDGTPTVAQTIEITPLARDGRVLVSFRFSDAFTEELRAAIHSGMNVTFYYQVELRRSTTFWLDRTMDTAAVATSVRHDTLTGKYHYTRMLNGRTERAEQTQSYDSVREWLTVFDKLTLFNTKSLERNAEYYVRVRVYTTPRNASFAWPWNQHDVMAQTKFTFLPH
jgi:hypothetical protein